MKKIIQIGFVGLSIFTCSCGNTQNDAVKNNTDMDTVINQDPSLLSKDSAILRDDSATIKTAVGVKEEEANAGNFAT